MMMESSLNLRESKESSLTLRELSKSPKAHGPHSLLLFLLLLSLLLLILFLLLIIIIIFYSNTVANPIFYVSFVSSLLLKVFTQFKFRMLQSKTIVRYKTLQQKSLSQLIKYMSKFKSCSSYDVKVFKMS